MSTSTAPELARLVQALQKERQEHVDAMGITPKPARRRGHPPAGTKAAPVKRRRRKAEDGMIGEQFLLSLLAKVKLVTRVADEFVLRCAGSDSLTGQHGYCHRLLTRYTPSS